MKTKQREVNRIRRLMLCEFLEKGDMKSAQTIAKIMQEDSSRHKELEQLHIIQLYYKQVSLKILLELLGISDKEYRSIINKYKVIDSQFYECEKMFGTVYQFAHYWGITRQQARKKLMKKGKLVKHGCFTVQTLYNLKKESNEKKKVVSNTTYQNQKFIAVKSGVEVARGTKKEIAELTGYSISRVNTACKPHHLKQAGFKALKCYRIKGD